MNTDLIKRTTLTEMVNAWKKAEADLRQAFALLVQVEASLKLVFDEKYYRFDLSRDRPEYRDYETPDRVLKELKKDVWRSLVDRMELRRILSVKRNKELDEQIENGEGLPDIDEVSLLAMLEGTLNNVPQLIEEAVKEVFEFLRPSRSEYKTNSEFEVGKRVVLAWALEGRYGGGWYVSHYKETHLRALDNVFHALDGKGTIHTYRGPLIDAINAHVGTAPGETDYFKFRCFRNRNLHIEFRRLDLVAKLNAVAGGMRLKP